MITYTTTHGRSFSVHVVVVAGSVYSTPRLCSITLILYIMLHKTVFCWEGAFAGEAAWRLFRGLIRESALIITYSSTAIVKTRIITNSVSR